MSTKIDGELNIYTATTWKEHLLPVLLEPGNPELDLSVVNEFDSAGLQILLLLRREARALGKELLLLAPSRCVMDTLELCHLTAGFSLSAGDSTQCTDGTSEVDAIDATTASAHADEVSA